MQIKVYNGRQTQRVGLFRVRDRFSKGLYAINYTINRTDYSSSEYS